MSRFKFFKIFIIVVALLELCSLTEANCKGTKNKGLHYRSPIRRHRHHRNLHKGFRSLDNEHKDKKSHKKKEKKDKDNDLSSVLEPIIVGGLSVKVSEYPYQVALYVDGKFNCGGSIISEEWVLSAAHCLTLLNLPWQYTIRSGSEYTTKGGQLHKVKRAIEHPYYGKPEKYETNNDFSLFQVKNKFPIGQLGVGKVPLAKKEPPVGSLLTVSGWGLTNEDGSVSKTLQAVKLPVTTREKCNEAYDNFITEKMICTLFPGGGKDACQGDSGGPAVDEEGKLAGVVSFGEGCARANYPGIFSNVAKARRWIRHVTGLDL